MLDLRSISSFTDFFVICSGTSEPQLKAIANEAGKKIWFAYPRWIEGEAAVVYHSGETGTNQLYVYRLAEGSTKRVSSDADADYRYPHGEAAPC